MNRPKTAKFILMKQVILFFHRFAKNISLFAKSKKNILYQLNNYIILVNCILNIYDSKGGRI